jgi:hypothetical protein
MNDIYDGKAKCDIAVYGSSRAWVHINPKILEDSLHQQVYNFGTDGQVFMIEYMRHLEFIKHNPKPKMIIFSVDVFTLQKRNFLYEPDQFLPYMLWNANLKNYTSTYNIYSKLDYYIPLVRYRGKHKALAKAFKNTFISKGDTLKFRYRGYAGMNRKWNDDLNKAKSEFGHFEIIFSPESIDLFDRFLNDCKRSNIKVVLVYTPEYIEGQDFVLNRNEVMETYKMFAKKYNLLFLDYSADSLSRKKQLFYNASHLNRRGANLFTLKLASRLKEAHGTADLKTASN